MWIKSKAWERGKSVRLYYQLEMLFSCEQSCRNFHCKCVLFLIYQKEPFGVFLVITSQKFLQHIPDHSLFLRRKVKNESFSKIILQFSEAQRIHFWSFKLKKNYQRNWIRSFRSSFIWRETRQTNLWLSEFCEIKFWICKPDALQLKNIWRSNSVLLVIFV